MIGNPRILRPGCRVRSHLPEGDQNRQRCCDWRPQAREQQQARYDHQGVKVHRCKRHVTYQGEDTVANQDAAGRQTQQQESNAGRTVRKT